jgi:hypothetical protein
MNLNIGQYCSGCAFIALLLYCIDATHAVGSGGILNLVPQAQVQVERNGSKQLVSNCRVYVHPMEGSLVLLSDGARVALAFDKNKRQAVEFNVDDIVVSKDGTTIDVPEKASYKVLHAIPHFGRTHASMLRDDGSRLIVDVKR